MRNGPSMNPGLKQKAKTEEDSGKEEVTTQDQKAEVAAAAEAKAEANQAKAEAVKT